MSDFAMRIFGNAFGSKVGNRPIYACTKMDHVAVLNRAKGKVIQCTSGIVWVTFRNDTQDYLLGPNDSLTVPNRGKALLSGKGCYLVE